MESLTNFRLPDVNIGDRVELIGGDFGKVVDITDNLGFLAFEIKLDNGKSVTEARYRFDVMSSADDVSVVSDITPNIGSELSSISNRFSSITNRFSNATENIDISQFIKGQQNRNTVKKTQSDINTLKEFLRSVPEERSIELIPPSELCELLCKFFIVLKKKNGENYEPNSIKGIYSSVERYLREHDYGISLTNDIQFSKLQQVIRSKLMVLKGDGKGNLQYRADAITDNDVDKLFESGQLGCANPDSLLRSLWFFNTVNFGMRGVSEHHSMRWGDVELHIDPTTGAEYLQYNERNTKTRTGVNTRDTRPVMPKVWSNPENPNRCPVLFYKKYSDMRPATYCNENDPFYIASNTNMNLSSKWYKYQPVGVNKLAKFMTTMAKNAGLTDKEKDPGEPISKRKITNHSARKFMIQKLNDKGVPPTQIMQISGHKNVQSINAYSKINISQQRSISHILNEKTNSAISQLENSRSTVVTTGLPSQMQNSRPICTVTSGHTTHNLTAKREFASIFGGPIYGGSFNITINNPQCKSPAIPIRKRCRRIVDSDSD